MPIFLIKTLQFLLAISLLVLLHEGGHFFFSKLFGVRVNKFYMFFDWKFSLFKKKIGETEYGVGWIPLGGYCQIEGMIDETQHDAEKLKAPAQDYEFRAKPTWQRLLIMIGGVLVNFLLALFIYSMVLYTWGDEYVATQDMEYGMKFNDDAKALGFRDGDILLSTELGAFKDFGADLYRDLADAKTCQIVRDGKQMTLDLPGDLDLLRMMQTQPSFVRPFIPAQIDSVPPTSPAYNIGMRAGDRILAIAGAEIDSWNELTNQLGRLTDEMTEAKTAADSLRIRTQPIVFKHADAETPDTAQIILTPDLRMEAFFPSVASLYKTTKREYGFFESFPAGVSYGMNILGGYVGDLRYLFSADGAKSLGGFGTIGNLFPSVWDWHLFWLMTAFLSIILAFMNILPIPALDGGHVLFLLYEIIFRRKPSDQFLIYAEYFGFGLLILLMIVANLNDVLRWIGLM